MTKKVYLTNQGLIKLKKELKDRQTTMARDIADRIEESRRMGDLSENAGYKAALDEREYNLARIRVLEEKVKMAEVFTGNAGNSKVDIGDSVKLKNGKQILEFRVVGATEADPTKSLISNESPIGASILGKREGDSVVISTPNGDIEYV